MKPNQRHCILLAVLVVVQLSWAISSRASALARQDTKDVPKTYVEYVAFKGRLVKEFGEQAEQTFDQNAIRITEILKLDADALQKLEAGDTAYVADAGVDSATLIANTRGSTIATSFYFAGLLEDAGRFPEGAKVLEDVVSVSTKLYSAENWRTLEYKLNLGKAKWLVERARSRLKRGNKRIWRTRMDWQPFARVI